MISPISLYSSTTARQWLHPVRWRMNLTPVSRGQGAEHEIESFGMGQLDLLLSQHRRLLAGWPARPAACLLP